MKEIIEIYFDTFNMNNERFRLARTMNLKKRDNDNKKCIKTI